MNDFYPILSSTTRLSHWLGLQLSAASTGTVSQLLLVKSPSLPVKSIAETPKSCYIAFLLPWLGHNVYSSIHAMPH